MFLICVSLQLKNIVYDIPDVFQDTVSANISTLSNIPTNISSVQPTLSTKCIESTDNDQPSQEDHHNSTNDNLMESLVEQVLSLIHI